MVGQQSVWLVRTVEEGAQEGAPGKAPGREQWCQCPVLLGSSDKWSCPGCTTNTLICSTSSCKEVEGALPSPEECEWKFQTVKNRQKLAIRLPLSLQYLPPKSPRRIKLSSLARSMPPPVHELPLGEPSGLPSHPEKCRVLS